MGKLMWKSVGKGRNLRYYPIKFSHFTNKKMSKWPPEESGLDPASPRILSSKFVPTPRYLTAAWSPDRDSTDKRQHDAPTRVPPTRVPGAHDGPVGCRIKLLFLEAFVC